MAKLMVGTDGGGRGRDRRNTRSGGSSGEISTLPISDRARRYVARRGRGHLDVLGEEQSETKQEEEVEEKTRARHYDVNRAAGMTANPAQAKEWERLVRGEGRKKTGVCVAHVAREPNPLMPHPIQISETQHDTTHGVYLVSYVYIF